MQIKDRNTEFPNRRRLEVEEIEYNENGEIEVLLVEVKRDEGEDPREITAREDVSDREDPRAMARAVRAEDSRAMEIVREDVSDREDHREMETVREEDRRAMARVVRTETEVKDVTDASAAVRDVRDSARIQERMTIWHLHRN